jgi:hypothetical protein
MPIERFGSLVTGRHELAPADSQARLGSDRRVRRGSFAAIALMTITSSPSWFLVGSVVYLEARFVNARNVREAMSAQRRLPQRPSRRAFSSASATVSSAVGTASRRSSGIGSPLWTERP